MNAIAKTEQLTLSDSSKNPLSSGPMATAIAALQAGMTVDQMKGLMELQKEWESNEARKAYVADMASFKLNPPDIYKTKLVAFSGTEYMHATLGDVTKAIVESLARHGFSHSWETSQTSGLIKVTCRITHRLGHSEATSMESSADISGKKNAIQAIASAQTYLSRYTLLQSCGLATMDMPDDDGQGYGPDPDRPFEDAKPALPGYSDQEFSDKLAGWEELIASGKKTPEGLVSFLQTKVSLTQEQVNKIKGV